MTAEHHEQPPSGEYTFAEVIGDPEAGIPFASALVKFDANRGRLYDDLSEFMRKVPGIISSGEKHEIELDGLSDQFAELLTYIEGKDIDSLKDTAVDIMLSDSTERVTLMRGLLGGDECIDFFDRDELESQISNTVVDADSYEDAIVKIAIFYDLDLNNDIEAFVRHLIKMHNSSAHDHEHDEAEETMLEIRKTPKDHVVDVAKIAAGVTIALAVDRLIGRFKFK